MKDQSNECIICSENVVSKHLGEVAEAATGHGAKSLFLEGPRVENFQNGRTDAAKCDQMVVPWYQSHIKESTSHADSKIVG